MSYYFRLAKNFVSSMGHTSYSVYLIPVPIAIFVMGHSRFSYIQQHLLVNILYDFIVYILIGLVAWVMYLGIERPSIRLSKKIANRSFWILTITTDKI